MLNHEAAPERVDIDDWFKEVTLFKRSPSAGGDSKHFGAFDQAPACITECGIFRPFFCVALLAIGVAITLPYNAAPTNHRVVFWAYLELQNGRPLFNTKSII